MRYSDYEIFEFIKRADTHTKLRWAREWVKKFRSDDMKALNKFMKACNEQERRINN